MVSLFLILSVFALGKSKNFPCQTSEFFNFAELNTKSAIEKLTCAGCASNCGGCNNNEYDCQQCAWQFFNDVADQTCVSLCSQGHFNYLNQRCEKCLPHCSICSIPGICHKCQEQFVLNQSQTMCSPSCPHFLLLQEGLCVQKCSSWYWEGDDSDAGKCLKMEECKNFEMSSIDECPISDYSDLSIGITNVPGYDLYFFKRKNGLLYFTNTKLEIIKRIDLNISETNLNFRIAPLSHGVRQTIVFFDAQKIVEINSLSLEMTVPTIDLGITFNGANSILFFTLRLISTFSQFNNWVFVDLETGKIKFEFPFPDSFSLFTRGIKDWKISKINDSHVFIRLNDNKIFQLLIPEKKAEPICENYQFICFLNDYQEYGLYGVVHKQDSKGFKIGTIFGLFQINNGCQLNLIFDEFSSIFNQFSPMERRLKPITISSYIWFYTGSKYLIYYFGNIKNGHYVFTNTLLEGRTFTFGFIVNSAQQMLKIIPVNPEKTIFRYQRMDYYVGTFLNGVQINQNLNKNFQFFVNDLFTFLLVNVEQMTVSTIWSCDRTTVPISLDLWPEQSADGYHMSEIDFGKDLLAEFSRDKIVLYTISDERVHLIQQFSGSYYLYHSDSSELVTSGEELMVVIDPGEQIFVNDVQIFNQTKLKINPSIQNSIQLVVLIDSKLVLADHSFVYTFERTPPFNQITQIPNDNNGALVKGCYDSRSKLIIAVYSQFIKIFKEDMSVVLRQAWKNSGYKYFVDAEVFYLDEKNPPEEVIYQFQSRDELNDWDDSSVFATNAGKLTHQNGVYVFQNYVIFESRKGKWVFDPYSFNAYCFSSDGKIIQFDMIAEDPSSLNFKQLSTSLTDGGTRFRILLMPIKQTLVAFMNNEAIWVNAESMEILNQRIFTEGQIKNIVEFNDFLMFIFDDVVSPLLICEFYNQPGEYSAKKTQFKEIQPDFTKFARNYFFNRFHREFGTQFITVSNEWIHTLREKDLSFENPNLILQEIIRTSPDSLNIDTYSYLGSIYLSSNQISPIIVIEHQKSYEFYDFLSETVKKKYKNFIPSQFAKSFVHVFYSQEAKLLAKFNGREFYLCDLALYSDSTTENSCQFLFSIEHKLLFTYQHQFILYSEHQDDIWWITRAKNIVYFDIASQQIKWQFQPTWDTDLCIFEFLVDLDRNYIYVTLTDLCLYVISLETGGSVDTNTIEQSKSCYGDITNTILYEVSETYLQLYSEQSLLMVYHVTDYSYFPEFIFMTYKISPESDTKQLLFKEKLKDQQQGFGSFRFNTRGFGTLYNPQIDFFVTLQPLGYSQYTSEAVYTKSNGNFQAHQSLISNLMFLQVDMMMIYQLTTNSTATSKSFTYTASKTFDEFIVNEGLQMVILKFSDSIELISYDEQQFVFDQRLILDSLRKIFFDPVFRRVVIDKSITNSEHRFMVWNPFNEGLPFMDYSMSKTAVAKKFAMQMDSQQQFVFYYNVNQMIYKQTEDQSAFMLPHNIRINRESYIKLISLLGEDIVILHSHADLRIIKESSGQEIRAGFGGKDILVDKANYIIFFFDWKFRVWAYDLRKPFSEVKSNLIINALYLKQFTLLNICQEFKHIIIIENYIDIYIYSYTGNSLFNQKRVTKKGLMISQVIIDANLKFLLLASEEKIMKFFYNADGTLTGKSDLLVFEDKKKGLQLDYLQQLNYLIISASITDPLVYFCKDNNEFIFLDQLRRPFPHYKTKYIEEEQIILLFSQLTINFYSSGNLRFSDALVMKDNHRTYQQDKGVRDTVMISKRLIVVIFDNVIKVFQKRKYSPIGEIGSWVQQKSIIQNYPQFLFMRKKTMPISGKTGVKLWFLNRFGFISLDIDDENAIIQNCQQTLYPNSLISLGLQIEKLERSFSQYSIGSSFQTLQIEMKFDNNTLLIFPQKLQNSYSPSLMISVTAGSYTPNSMIVTILNEFFDVGNPSIANIYLNDMIILVRRNENVEFNKAQNLKIIEFRNIDWVFQQKNSSVQLKDLDFVKIENIRISNHMMTRAILFSFENIKSLSITNLTITDLKLFSSTLFSFKRIENLILENIIVNRIDFYPFMLAESFLFRFQASQYVTITGVQFSNINTNLLTQPYQLGPQMRFLDITQNRAILISVKASQKITFSKMLISNVELATIEILQEYRENLDSDTFQDVIPVLSQVSFENITCQAITFKVQAFIYTNFDKIMIQDAIFQNINCTNSNGLVYSEKSSSIQILRTFFDSIYSISDGFLQFADFQELDFIDSVLSNNYAKGRGGCISLLNQKNVTESAFYMQDTIFRNNQGGLGGSIYLKNINQRDSTSELKNVTFEFNEAFEFGGCIYSLNSDFTIKNSLIVGNKAHAGGFLYYLELIPSLMQKQIDIVTNNFSLNEAINFGQNFASHFRSFKIEIFNNNNQTYHQIDDFKLLLPSFKSGDQISVLYSLFDEQQQQLTLNTSQVASYPANVRTFLENIDIRIKFPNSLKITGETIASIEKFNSQQSFFQFDFQLIGSPPSDGEFQIISESIKNYDFNNPKIFKPINDTALFIIQFRQCQPGELYFQTEDPQFFICSSCLNNTYSLEEPIQNRTQECKTCPFGAQQCIQNEIFLKNGFWQQNNSDIVVKCQNELYCEDESKNSRMSCVEGHIGPVCETCDIFGEIWDQKYTEVGYHVCSKCSKSFEIVLISIAKFLAFNIYLLYSIKSNLERSIKSVKTLKIIF